MTIPIDEVGCTPQAGSTWSHWSEAWACPWVLGVFTSRSCFFHQHSIMFPMWIPVKSTIPSGVMFPMWLPVESSQELSTMPIGIMKKYRMNLWVECWNVGMLECQLECWPSWHSNTSNVESSGRGLCEATWGATWRMPSGSSAGLGAELLGKLRI